MLGGRSWSVEQDPRVGAWSEFDEREHAARLRSSRGQRDEETRLWSEVV